MTSLFTNCVALGESLNFSEPEFIHLQSGDDDNNSI